MEIKDKEVLKHLKEVNSSELSEYVRTFPEEELEDKSEMDVLKGELDYLLEKYSDPDVWHCKELKEAKKFLKETNDGKSFSLDIALFDSGNLSGHLKAQKQKVDEAREFVAEYKRLQKLAKELGIR